MLAVTSITFFFMADVKCGLYEINKNNRANATRRPSPVQKMFRDQTEAMLDQRGPGPGPGSVLTLIVGIEIECSLKYAKVRDGRAKFS